MVAAVMIPWWRERPVPGLIADAAFFAAALACTLLVAWLAGLVSLAGIVGRTGQVPDRSRRRVRILVAVLVPIVAALLLLRGASGRGAGEEAEAAPFSPDLPRERLLFVGVDGLDASLLEDLEPRGAVAGLLERMGAGAVFPLRREGARDPAEVWTTFMTGLPPGSMASWKHEGNGSTGWPRVSTWPGADGGGRP